MVCNENILVVGLNDIDWESFDGSTTSLSSDEDILDTSGNVPYQFEPVPVVVTPELGKNMQQYVHGGQVAVPTCVGNTEWQVIFGVAFFKVTLALIYQVLILYVL